MEEISKFEVARWIPLHRAHGEKDVEAASLRLTWGKLPSPEHLENGRD